MGKKALFLLGLLALSAVWVNGSENFEEDGEAAESLVSDVLTLDVGNFTETIEKYDFIVVEFYAPWCGHCKRLAPEYEKAATILKNNDPPIILAKVDLDDEYNKPLASEFNIAGFPTLKIIKNKGQLIQDYSGPRESDGIVSHLQKLSGPPSVELKSAEEAEKFLADNEKNLVVIGVFDKLEGEEYESFFKVADALRSDYEFAHTASSSIVPEDGVPVTAPSVRVIKNFEEKITVSSDLSTAALSKFIEETSLPSVTEMSKKPEHRPALMKFFESTKTKLFLFMAKSTEEDAESKDLLTKFTAVAKANKDSGLIALFAESDESDNALQFFGLEKADAPAVVIQEDKGKKYILKNVVSSKVAPWVAAYLKGELKEHIKSEPIPETNDEPVKVIVSSTLQTEVLDAKKNVLLEFYAPWCGHCKKLAPVLDEVAVSFEKDDDVVIAKFDATANDVSSDLFDVQGFPTIYLYTAGGAAIPYDGDRSKEDITKFINDNRTKPEVEEKKGSTIGDATSPAETLEEAVDAVDMTIVKDEL
ncbi:hypothetical protein R1sor_006677 [Riccia sorocarpa]|uniref:Protein disulfide-isomerase n=1 Tax=Riccia sorocarpa TaxID=122646 RepID=A0ABD3HSD2_9MARC